MIRLAILVFFLMGFIIWYIRHKGEPSPTRKYRSIDALVAAFNEEAGIELTVRDLLRNRYIRKVVCVNDGSSDNTGPILDNLHLRYPDRVIVVHQENMGKPQAMNNGLKHIETQFFLTTDADTRIPDGEGIGYMAAHLKGKTAAVCGIPASDLKGAGLLPKIRASIKASFTVMRKTAMEMVGGSPHVISGSCGLYQTDVIKKIGIPTRTAVEDMDLTWILVEQGYRVDQSIKYVVFVQECNSLREEMVRWRRWIAGYAICMRIHWKLMFSRFGIGVILPVAALGMCGLILFYVAPVIFFYLSQVLSGTHQYPWWIATSTIPGWGPVPWWVILSPFWIPIVMVLAIYSAYIQKDWKLVLFSPFSVLILLMSLWTWLRWGIPTLISGKEPPRVKPIRYNGNNSNSIRKKKRTEERGGGGVTFAVTTAVTVSVCFYWFLLIAILAQAQGQPWVLPPTLNDLIGNLWGQLPDNILSSLPKDLFTQLPDKLLSYVPDDLFGRLSAFLR